MSLLNTALMLTTVTTILLVAAVIVAGGAAATANRPAVVPGAGEAFDCSAQTAPSTGVRVILAPMAGMPDGCRPAPASPAG